MSFSYSAKNELCRIENGNPCCIKAELAAAIRISGNIKFERENPVSIRIITENAAFARRIFLNLKNTFGIVPQVINRRSKKLKKHATYIIILTSSHGVSEFLHLMGIEAEYNVANENCSIKYIPYSEINEVCDCCNRAYLRGAFLSNGSISDPEKAYHLEISTHDIELARELERIMSDFGLNPKTVTRKGNYVTYLKEGENIVDFLNIVGAHNALLELENIRILKEMRNNVNRIVNCETANLEKTVNASVRQVENIKYIINKTGMSGIPEKLQEIALKRIEHPHANLKELGEMLNPPIGKSGVNHRLKKIDEIAEKLRKI